MKLHLPAELLASIDSLRGETPRERFIRDRLAEFVAAADSLVSPNGVPPTPEPAPAPPRSERRAFICMTCRSRVFLSDGEPYRVPDCPQHGPMIRQLNRPYRGQEVPTVIPDGFSRDVVDPMELLHGRPAG